MNPTELDEFNALTNDVDRWRWVAANQDKGITVMCDNDQTYLRFEGYDDETGDFDDYIGWSRGVFTLLSALGIKAESV